MRINSTIGEPDGKPDVREAAKVLWSSGFALCRPDPKDKMPTYSGWPTRSLRAKDFRDGDQIGILGGPLSDGVRPGHATVIIDLDTAEALELADEYLPPTAMIEGRPGKPRSHRYFLVPVSSIPDWAESKAEQAAAAALEVTGHPGPLTKSFSHRETKAEVLRLVGTGGQCVCPPSAHPSGELREWEGGERGDPAIVDFLDLWDALCRLASACCCKIPDLVPRPDTRRGQRPTEEVLERARAYVAKCPAAVSGHAGHDQTFAVARAVVWGFDLPLEDALKLLRDDFNPRCQPPWSDAELRHKVEDAGRIPFGKTRGYLLDAAAPESDDDGDDDSAGDEQPAPPPTGSPAGGAKPKPADVLTAIGLEFELWHDNLRVAHATQDRRTYRVRSRDFKLLLVAEYRRRSNGKVANAESVSNALTAIEAEAIHAGVEQPAHVRIAGHEGCVYLHLADIDDTVIQIDGDGWRVCDDPPVRFCRVPGMQELPLPLAGGDLNELRDFLNLPDDGAFALAVAWLAGCFCPDGPFPLLVLLGEQGSAKSTTSRALRCLIDRNSSPVRSEPREVRDLMIAARGSWVVTIDNVSDLRVWLSDAFCRLATGGGFSTRTLYTDADEVIFDAKRPVILNGITDFVERADLLERSILLRHRPIPEERRRPESEFWAAFHAAHPRLLGALLDRVSAGLRQLAHVNLGKLPRMADFARFAVACERGAGEEPLFLAAYRENQAGAHLQALESTPIAAAVVAFMGVRRERFEGTATELLNVLTAELPAAGDGVPLRPHGWPKRANELGNILRRLAPDLRRVHRLEVDCDGRTHRGRLIRITRLPDDAPKSSSRSSRSSPAKDSMGTPRDDAPGEATGASARRRHASEAETPGKSMNRDDRDDRDDVLRPLPAPSPVESESFDLEELLTEGVRAAEEARLQRARDESQARLDAARAGASSAAAVSPSGEDDTDELTPAQLARRRAIRSQEIPHRNGKAGAKKGGGA